MTLLNKIVFKYYFLLIFNFRSFFKSGDYYAAINAFNLAIRLNPKMPLYSFIECYCFILFYFQAGRTLYSIQIQLSWFAFVNLGLFMMIWNLQYYSSFCYVINQINLFIWMLGFNLFVMNNIYCVVGTLNLLQKCV